MFVNPDRQDRRQFQRVKLGEAVQFQLSDPQYFGGSLGADVSEGGLRVNFGQFIPLGTEVSLQIHLSEHDVVEGRGRVVWVEKFPFNERFLAGIQFNEDGNIVFARQRIRSFVEESVNAGSISVTGAPDNRSGERV